MATQRLKIYQRQVHDQNKFDYFKSFAEQSIAAPVKARMRAVEKRRATLHQERAVQKVLKERDLLMRLWKLWRKEILNEALAGDYAKPIEALIKFLKQLKFKQDDRLLPFIEKGPWLAASPDIKFLALRLIAARLTQLQEQHELPPFDDPLPGQPLSPFLIIRNRFIGRQ